MSLTYVPAADDASLGLVHDHAYWVSRLSPASTSPGAGSDPASGGSVAAGQAPPAKAVVDAFSHGFGRGDAPSTRGTDAGSEPLPYTEVRRT